MAQSWVPSKYITTPPEGGFAGFDESDIKTFSPIENLSEGPVVPMPTLPVLSLPLGNLLGSSLKAGRISTRSNNDGLKENV